VGFFSIFSLFFGMNEKKDIAITGAGRGYGLELTKIFLKNNYRCFAVVREASQLDKIQKEYPDDCIPVTGDVTSMETCKKLASAIEANSGKLDVLINNAGNVVKKYGFTTTTTEQMREHFEVHVNAVLQLCQVCYPFLKKAKKGIIINVSSRKGSIDFIYKNHFKSLYPYQVAKCAQNMLTASMNKDLNKENIFAYSIHPGKLKTSVGPYDADTSPAESAMKLYEWIINEPDKSTGEFIDLMEGKVIPW